MKKSFFPFVQTWLLPETALSDSLREMAGDGVSGNEGIVLWLGSRRDGLAQVTHLVGLRGPNVIKQPSFLKIQTPLLNDVTDLAIELGVSLIGQIHSHGPSLGNREYATNLSMTDRLYGIRVPYYLSVVAPDYAIDERIGILDCGVHVFEPDQGYRRLSNSEVEQRITVVTRARPPFVIIGEES